MRNRNRTIEVLLLGLLTGAAVVFSANVESLRANEELATDPPPQGQMPPDFDAEVARVVAELDQIEADTLRQLDKTTLDRQGQIHTLGKLMLFDKHLSVNQNEACSFCHTPETGFTGPIQSLNLSTVSYPGSVRTRFSQRKPQSYMYATFAPVLHYNDLQGDFVGGNFWDMRASGYRLQSPSAEQAQGPPTNPVEMGLPDSACLAYRLSKAPYRKLFETVWGVGLVSRFTGQQMSKKFARLPVLRRATIRTPFISAQPTASVPTTSTTSSAWQLPPTRLRRRSVHSLRSTTMYRPERTSSPHRKSGATRCSAARRMQPVSSRWRTWRRAAVHGLHRQQSRSPQESRDSSITSKPTPDKRGYRRELCRISLYRYRRRIFLTQPTKR